MLLFLARLNRDGVGQSARCVCIVSLFPPSLSLDVYIHSRFCGQLRVQCAMGCHWDDKSPKFPLLTPAHRRRCHTHTHNRTHLRPSYPVVHQRSFRSIIIYCTFGRWSAFHLIEQRWLPCRRPSDTGKKKETWNSSTIIFYRTSVYYTTAQYYPVVGESESTDLSLQGTVPLTCCLHNVFLSTNWFLLAPFVYELFFSSSSSSSSSLLLLLLPNLRIESVWSTERERNMHKCFRPVVFSALRFLLSLLLSRAGHLQNLV